MAALKPGSNLDKWRDYFRTCNSDIFDIIEHGIMVAASDCPQEFKLKRDGIAETLFSSKLIKCAGCDHIELSVPDKREVDERCKAARGNQFGDGADVSKDTKVDSGSGHRGGEMSGKEIVSNYSYTDAEALTDEIEHESQIFGEVVRIKEIVDNSENEAGSLVLESLRRLQLMPLSVEILKATEIGKAVNALRKHSSKDIQQLARSLIEGWKVMVDEWVAATTAIAGGLEGGTPDSVNPSVVDEEEGLPSPPLDDLFFATDNTSMELSQFFDGLDDDLNPRNCEELNKNSGNGRKPPVWSHNIPNQPNHPKESIAPPKFKKNEQTTKEEASTQKHATVLKPNKPSIAQSGPGRPTRPNLENKARAEGKLQEKSKLAIPRPPASQQNKPRYSDEDAVKVKLEESKRKLQERYQQVENAKRQRTIQVMELHDLPKQSVGHRNLHAKLVNRNGSSNRQWANGRR